MSVHTFSLNEPQLRLVLELVQTEQNDLPHEIRHTDSIDVREALHARLVEINQLADMLREEMADAN